MKLICFDLDDTLWDFGTCLPRAEAELHAWLQAHYPDFVREHSMESLRERRSRLLKNRPELRHDISRVRCLAMQQAAERSGYDPEAATHLASAAFRKFMLHRNDVKLFDDVLPTLEHLRRKYLLVSLTNGNADLRQIGIHDMFHHSLAAEHIGAAKPEPAMFREACRLAGVDPAEAVHVGDHPDHDILAAQAAGMRAIWINRHALPWPHPQRADAEIRSLAELEACLRRLAPALVS